MEFQDFNPEPGDIVHVRSKSFYGWAIRRCLPSWGNHDGILVRHDGQWKVAEAVMPKFKMTDWEEYRESIDSGKKSVVFFRVPLLPFTQRVLASHTAIELAKLGPKYDWPTVLRIWANIAFKANSTWNCHWRWYCTEAVSMCYAQQEADVWGLETMPTPHTTEKRHKEGKLEMVGQLGESKYV